MKLKLLSDYRDFYDAMFDKEIIGPRAFTAEQMAGEEGYITLIRRCGNGIAPIGYSKREQFEILEKTLVQPVVPHATAGHYARMDLDCVVYFAPYAHAGNGLGLASPQEVFQAFPNTSDEILASEFIYTRDRGEPGGVSYKYLQIGTEVFWFKITSDKDWRTNVDTTDVELLSQHPAQYERRAFAPLYAIDYVQGFDSGRWYATDLNMAPGCKGLGLSKDFSATEMVGFIRAWFAEFGTDRPGLVIPDPAGNA